MPPSPATNGAPPHTLSRARPTIEEVASAVVLVEAFDVGRCHAPALSFSRAKRDSEPRGGGQGAWLDDATSLSLSSVALTRSKYARPVAGPSNTKLGAAKFEFGGVCIAFFTAHTAKYSPKYFRICEYGPYLAFLACGCARPRAGTTVSNRHPICMCSQT